MLLYPYPISSKSQRNHYNIWKSLWLMTWGKIAKTTVHRQLVCAGRGPRMSDDCQENWRYISSWLWHGNSMQFLTKVHSQSKWTKTWRLFVFTAPPNPIFPLAKTEALSTPRKAQAADATATWCRYVAVVIFSSSRGRPVISARPSGSNASCRCQWAATLVV